MRLVLTELTLPPCTYDPPISLGALVQLDHEVNKWFFITPVGAGFRKTIKQETITFITPQSPLGKSLINKQVGDEVHLLIAKDQLIKEITAIQ
ncbi:GreA/GreB family elongation factor [Thalassotalea piscium]|uniref:Transcription elongation GreA/GreB family factor n=1 Tax=Thalassotalea piscium TaxID=1230533 RepID=A0A7X0NJ09_9GAMM|nr:GreA/GreB family elongation factor [Thalassotalea piscium]MBB6544324.1 transcription elongation GreA/GreB family factor [Thalassotalea piscium]